MIWLIVWICLVLWLINCLLLLLIDKESDIGCLIFCILMTLNPVFWVLIWILVIDEVFNKEGLE
jgi:hypothetical protein